MQVTLDGHNEIALLYYLLENFWTSYRTDFISVEYTCPTATLYPIPNKAHENHFDM